MKQVLSLILAIYTTVSFGQVFKCEDVTGKIVYQDSECFDSDKQKDILIQFFDNKRTLKAQELLRKQLQLNKENQLTQQQLDLKRQAIQAIYEQTESNKELTEETRKNINATKTARKSKNYLRPLNDYYYLNPYYKEKSKFKGHKHRKRRQNDNKQNHSSWMNPPMRKDTFNPPIRN